MSIFTVFRQLREVLSGYPRIEPHDDYDDRRYEVSPGQASLLASDGEARDPVVTVRGRDGDPLAEFEAWVGRAYERDRSSCGSQPEE